MANTSRKTLTGTGILATNVAKTEFTSVPGLTWTPAEVVASLVGGVNGQGQEVAGGWHDIVCDVCGEPAHWCPDFRAVLPREFVDARLAAEAGPQD